METPRPILVTQDDFQRENELVSYDLFRIIAKYFK